MEPPFSRKGASGDQKGPRIEEEVGMSPDSETCLWAISSTRLFRRLELDLKQRGEVYIRFQASNVRNAVHLVPGLVAGVVHVAHFVQELHSDHPLVDRELDLPGEVMEMLEQLGENEASARRGVWANCVDDILREVGVEAVLRLLRL